mgnify:FL=1
MHFDHVAVRVGHIQAAVNWYRSLFGATVIYQDENWSLLSVGDTKVALVLEDSHPPHFALRVNSQEDLLEPAEHRDGSLYNYIVDPWGNTVELIYYPSEKN